jgi:hypothetical protein
MRPLNALQQAVSTAVREPIVLGVAALVSLLQIPVLLAQLLEPPLYATVASLGVNLVILVLAPFTQGGMIGLADRALDGRGTFRTFLAAGRDNYVSMFVAYLLLIAVTVVLTVVTLLLLLVVGTGLGAVAAGVSSTPGVMLPGGVVGLVVVGLVVLVGLAVLVAFLFIQFYGQAIVIDDYGAAGGFKRSAGLVRRHLLSTLGYSVVVFLGGGTLGLVGGVASTLISGDVPGTMDLGVTAPALVAGLILFVYVVSTLSSVFASLYSVAFYRDLGVDEASGVSQL